MTAMRAILDGIEEHLSPRLIEQALANAAERGLLEDEQITELRGRMQALAA